MSYTSAFGGNYIDSFLSQSVASQQQITELQNNINALRDIFYPVGAIYISVSPIDPSTFIGGTWERLKGVYLYGHDDNPDQGVAGVFGSWYHTHTTGDCTLTIAQMPAHNHGVYCFDNGSTTRDPWGSSTASNKTTNAYTTLVTGGSQPHNHGNTG